MNRPNFVVICSDQRHPGIAVCRGHPLVQPPHPDRLAAEVARGYREGPDRPGNSWLPLIKHDAQATNDYAFSEYHGSRANLNNEGEAAMKMNWQQTLIASGMVAVLLAGCSGNGGSGNGEGSGSTAAPPPAAPKNEPVTLSFLQTSAQMTDEEFQKWVVEPAKKKYPHITLNLVREDSPEKLTQMVAAGGLPDVIYAGPVTAAKIVELQAAKDMNERVKTNQVDLGKFEPAGIDTVKRLSNNNGQLNALSMAFNFSVLYYNKDIFDLFALPYPKDGMMWTDAIELAKKLTRMEGGVQYRGLAIDGNINRLGEQLSLPMVDLATQKSALQTAGWQTVFQTYRDIGSINGNWLENPQRIPAFEKDRNLAMLAGLSARLGELEQLQNTGAPLNWDMATLPAFPQAPKNVYGGGVFYLMMSSNTKNEDAAFKIIQMLTEDESQTRLSKQGRRSALKDPKYSQIFGEELKTLQGKNKNAIFNMQSAPEVPSSIFYDAAFKELVAGGNQVAKNLSTDVNTIIRETDDKINKAVEAIKSK